MAYNFDKIINRHDTNSLKWDAPKFSFSKSYCESRDIIPMWIADMDFETPEFIIDAIKKRLEHPLFGYSYIADDFYEAIGKWQKARYNQDGVGRANVAYQNSVLGGLAAALMAFSQPGDKVMLHTATYTGFQSTISNLGRTMVFSDLVKDDKGIFRMDYEAMDKRLSAGDIPVFVFCSPHNPSGRVWEKEEIIKLVDICEKHGVVLVSDEIWADFIVDENKSHIPTTSVSEKAKAITIALCAPSKTFNLAGLVGAYSLCFNPVMNKKLARAAGATHYNLPSVLSTAAMTAAYEGGAAWVDERNAYIRKNMQYLVDCLNKFDGVKTYMPEATYLIWTDVSGTGRTIDDIFADLKSVGIIVNDGRDFKGDGYVRFNCSCPFSVIEDACNRLQKVFNK